MVHALFYNSAMRSLRLALLLSLSIVALPAQDTPVSRVALVGGTVIRTDGSASLDNAVVLIEGDRIVTVGSRDAVPVPEGTKVIDAVGKWIVPGLVDGHVHFFQSAGLYTRPDVIELRRERSYADEQADIDARLSDTLARYVRCGITTVVDVGGPDRNFAIRERARRTAIAPQVYCSGRLLTTWLPPAYQNVEDRAFAPVRTPDDCAAEVERQVALGTDLIKVWYIVRRDEDVVGNRPLLDATVTAAKRHGLRVAVHSTQLAAAKEAVAAGASILVHSVQDAPVDEAFLAALAKSGTVYIPTLMVVEGYAEVLGRKRNLMPVEWQLGQPEVIGTWLDLDRLVRSEAGLAGRSQSFAARLAAGQVLHGNLAAVHERGGVIAAGTDAGNIGTLHGPSLFRELELMVAAGMSPMDVLASATRGGAKVLGKEAEFGDVAAGQRADLLVLDADPRRDIAALQQLAQVVLRGAVLQAGQILIETPAQVVQRQLNAYNERDIDRFADTYGDDVIIGDLLPTGPVERMRGKAALRARWGDMFERTPELHCRLMNRISNGETVIDHELVTGRSGGVVRAVAIYRVQNGKIVSVWFVR